jgi:hypothetical protein
MARRKKTHRKTHRRRRIGSAGGGIGNDAMQAVGLVAGSVAATVMQRTLSSMDSKIVSGGQIVAGFLLKKHGKSPFMEGMGWGVMGAGAIGLTHEVGLIHGINDMVSGLMNPGMDEYEYNPYAEREMRGLGNGQRVAGMNNGARIAGDGMETEYNIPALGM